MPSKPQTLKYATVDGLDMHLEVIVPESATTDIKAPIYLWFVSRNSLEKSSTGRQSQCGPVSLLPGLHIRIFFSMVAACSR